LNIQPLYDTHDVGFHWLGKAKNITVEDDDKLNMLTATIKFDCYPFAIANNVEGSDVWDEVFFPHWIFQDTKYTVNGTQVINLYNIGSKSIECELVVSGSVTVAG